MDVLTRAVAVGIERAMLHTPDSDNLGTWPIVWGRPDLRPIESTELDGDTLTDTIVARYVAKYSTKGAEASGVELPPLACRDCTGTGRLGQTRAACRRCHGTGTTVNLADYELSDHARRLCVLAGTSARCLSWQS